MTSPARPLSRVDSIAATAKRVHGTLAGRTAVQRIEILMLNNLLADADLEDGWVPDLRRGSIEAAPGAIDVAEGLAT